MKRCLCLLFSLWIAVALVVTPMGAARATTSCPGEMPRSASTTIHRMSDAATGAASAAHHAPSKGRDAGAPAMGLGCCASSCIGMTLLPSLDEAALATGERESPVRLSERLPEGITTAPPLFPPITAV